MMVSLTYDASTGRLCGELAIDIVQQIKIHNAETTQPSSFRFHMATSLGGAILILATLLTRPLSVIGLQDNQPAYAENFREGVAMLRDLATYLQAARRIADDLEDIIQVVTSVLNQARIAPQEEFMSVVPANIDNLFPYGAIDFAQQTGLPDEHVSDGGGGASRSGSGMFTYDALNSLDSWHNELQPTVNGYGVPWI